MRHAELIIQVGTLAPEPAYQDKDILFVVNGRRIRHCHAEMICDVRKAGFNGDGLRPTGGIAQEWFEATHEFRFQRVSEREVRRTLIATGIQDTLSTSPNAAGEFIHAFEHVNHLRRSNRHAVFGTDGAETWYGGNLNLSDAALDKVWTKIETDTPLREVDHENWPFTGIELRKHLVYPCRDFADSVANDIMLPEFGPPNADATRPVIRKRTWFSNYETLPGVVAEDVRDPRVKIDLRHMPLLPLPAIAHRKAP